MQVKNTLKFYFILSLLGFSIIIYEHGPTWYYSVKSWLYGSNEISKITTLISQNESNSIDVLHEIADWEDANLEYDASSRYYLGFIKVRRKIPPSAYYTVFIRRGACDEYSYFFKTIASELGYVCRVVKNPGEDHAWNEIMINGTWIHFDSTLSTEKRYNHPEQYERSRNDGGWGKNLSYVYYMDENGERHSITERYTKTGRLIIDFNSSQFPLYGINLIVKSKSLMEWRPDKFKKPITCYKEKIMEKGKYEYDLGGNNYIIIIKWGILKRNVREYEISVKENSIEKLQIIL